MAQISLFRRVLGHSKSVSSGRLDDQEVARLIKKTALTSGIRGDLPEIERGLKFAGHSLRPGTTSSVEVHER